MNKFKEYIKYIKSNLITGKYTLGFLMILTMIIYAILFSKYYILGSIIELIIGGAICISYSNFEYDNENKL